MLTSARNTLNGTIISITPGAVHSEVVLSFGNQQVVAIITNASVERLNMKVGESAYALIKSSAIILSKTRPERISARNVLALKINEVIHGAVNAEIKMSLDTTTMTAIITNDSCDELELKAGEEVYAIFKASNVIVGMA